MRSTRVWAGVVGLTLYLRSFGEDLTGVGGFILDLTRVRCLIFDLTGVGGFILDLTGVGVLIFDLTGVGGLIFDLTRV
jgi:hypothetical protein